MLCALLAAAVSAPPSKSAPPFRAELAEAKARLDYRTGRRDTAIFLDALWEKPWRVFRIDAYPTVTTVTDGRGRPLTATQGKTAVQPSGGRARLQIRLTGVGRGVKLLRRLRGHFTAVVADGVLLFAFAKPGSAAMSQAKKGVTAELSPLTRRGDFWEVTLRLKYPDGQPEFESFEGWLGENRLKLLGPGRSVHQPTAGGVTEAGDTATATYRFRAADFASPPGGDGWTLFYETPAPLREVRVPFDFRGVKLP